MRYGIILAVALLSSACSRHEKLEIRTITFVTENDVTKKDNVKIAEIDSDYFQISLVSYEDGSYYQAENRSAYDPHINTWDMIVESDSIVSFKTSNDFLNFMSKKGYDMIDQKKLRHNIEYTFKRK